MRHNTARLETDPFHTRDIQLIYRKIGKNVDNFMHICDMTHVKLINWDDGWTLENM